MGSSCPCVRFSLSLSPSGACLFCSVIESFWNELEGWFPGPRAGSFNSFPKYTSSLDYKYHWFYPSSAHGLNSHFRLILFYFIFCLLSPFLLGRPQKLMMHTNPLMRPTICFNLLIFSLATSFLNAFELFSLLCDCFLKKSDRIPYYPEQKILKNLS